MKESNVCNRIPYSCQRIKQILKEDYHYRLEARLGYKCNRYKGYVQKYRMIDDDTGEVLAEKVTLDALRLLLTKKGYPLYKPIQRCKGAEEFMNCVEELRRKVVEEC